MGAHRHLTAALIAAALLAPGAAAAETLKVLTAGAFKQVLLAVQPSFEAKGDVIAWETDTVGGITRRIEAGEAFDVVFASPAALDGLAQAGRTEARADLARVGVGVAVRQGAPKPDLSSTDAFKAALLAARAVAYIDPASGGTSGIYVARLLAQLGIADQLRPKSVLVKGGYAAERVVAGAADLAIQQISELLPVAGAEFAGPLPAEIQAYTVYAGAIAPTSGKAGAARALIALLQSGEGRAAITSKGMEPVAAPAGPPQP